MTRIEKKGALGTGGHAVLIGLLLSVASCQAADSLEEEVSSLKLKLNLSMNRYRLLCKEFSNLANSCSAPVVNCGECTQGWLQVGDQCFLLSSDRNNYTTSVDKCAETDSHLAILTTKAQHDAVEREGRKIGGLYTYFWIGLSDIESEGVWKWVDKSTLTTAFWDKLQSQPDNNVSGGPEGENCAVVNSYTQMWYDVPCSFTYPRLCQRDALPPH